MLLTWTFSLSELFPSATPLPLLEDFVPRPFSPLHKLYIHARIYLARTLRLVKQPKNPGFRVVRLSKAYYLKWGVHDSEARSMCFVRERTSVPVPRVLGFWTDPSTRSKKTVNYMLIEALPGTPVGEIWDELSNESQKRFRKDFVEYINQLRRIEQPLASFQVESLSPRSSISSVSHDGTNAPPYSSPLDISGRIINWDKKGGSGGYIGALGFHPLTDHRIATVLYGPYENYTSWLNCEYLLGYVKRARPPETYQRLYDTLTAKPYKIVFTHADLTPRNILVDKETGAITGIIDWDSAGWNVEWWEGIKGVYGLEAAMKNKRPQSRDTLGQRSDDGCLRDLWGRFLKDAIGDFDAELKADEEIRDIYGFPF